jgi:hypothetical protein
MVVEKFLCRRMAWIVLSGTPSRCRFVANPLRNAYQDVPLKPRQLQCLPDDKLRQSRQIQRPTSLRLEDQTSLRVPQ